MARLPDELLLEIAGALPRPPYRALAERFGVSYGTVHKTATRIRRAGGLLCPLEARVCPECGGILLTRAGGPRRSHPACGRARSTGHTEQGWRGLRPVHPAPT